MSGPQRLSTPATPPNGEVFTRRDPPGRGGPDSLLPRGSSPRAHRPDLGSGIAPSHLPRRRPQQSRQREPEPEPEPQPELQPPARPAGRAPHSQAAASRRQRGLQPADSAWPAAGCRAGAPLPPPLPHTCRPGSSRSQHQQRGQRRTRSSSSARGAGQIANASQDCKLGRGRPRGALCEGVASAGLGAGGGCRPHSSACAGPARRPGTWSCPQTGESPAGVLHGQPRGCRPAGGSRAVPREQSAVGSLARSSFVLFKIPAHLRPEARLCRLPLTPLSSSGLRSSPTARPRQRLRASPPPVTVTEPPPGPPHSSKCLGL